MLTTIPSNQVTVSLICLILTEGEYLSESFTATNTLFVQIIL